MISAGSSLNYFTYIGVAPPRLVAAGQACGMTSWRRSNYNAGKWIKLADASIQFLFLESERIGKNKTQKACLNQWYRSAITEFKISVTNNNIKIFQAVYVVQKTPTACYNIVATKSMESILWVCLHSWPFNMPGYIKGSFYFANLCSPHFCYVCLLIIKLCPMTYSIICWDETNS